ncbi:MAG: transposase, partial [Candidatus Omnitrophica bacterium]|nr:transposase [Candidatus Omnitrophota bacterium]
EMWPGDTTDVMKLKVLTKLLTERFGSERICVVSDRGMISKKALKELEKEGIHYILGVRMRRNLELIKPL